MSDLTATNCGGGCGCNNGFGNNSCIWIIIILLFCCNGNGFGGCDRGCDRDCNNGLFGGDCSCIIIIILLLCFCGGSNGLFGCGC